MADSPATAAFAPGAALNLGILSLIGDAVVCTDAGGHILMFNCAAEACFGYAAEEVLGRAVELLLPERFRAHHAEELQRFASGAGAAVRLMGSRHEVTGRRRNGEEFPLESRLSRNEIDGQVVLTVVHRDISERKELEALRAAIAHEADHRMKNLLAVVTSLVALSARDAPSVEAFRRSLTERIRALASSESAFAAGSGSASTDLAALVRRQLGHYAGPDGANIRIGGAPVRIGPRPAQLLALAFHELATNALKHGALGSPQGCVSVTIETPAGAAPGAAGRGVVITWRERGGPPVSPPSHEGFGTVLIRRVVARGLGAEVAMRFEPEGLVCTITCPDLALPAD